MLRLHTSGADKDDVAGGDADEDVRSLLTLTDVEDVFDRWHQLVAFVAPSSSSSSSSSSTSSSSSSSSPFSSLPRPPPSLSPHHVWPFNSLDASVLVPQTPASESVLLSLPLRFLFKFIFKFIFKFFLFNFFLFNFFQINYILYCIILIMIIST